MISAMNVCIFIKELKIHSFFKCPSLYFLSCNLLLFPMIDHTSVALHHHFFHSPWCFLVDMSVFLFTSVCMCVCVCPWVLTGLASCCCCFLLQWCWDYFGNPLHLPHPLSCGDVGCSGLGQTLLDGCESLSTVSEGWWYVTLAFLPITIVTSWPS